MEPHSVLTPTPTDPGQATRPGTFATLADALDYAAAGRCGMNFHTPRGDLAEVLRYADLSQQARETGGRLLACGLKSGDRVGLIAETEADFVRAFMGCLFARLIPCPMPLPAAFGAKGAYGGQLQRIAAVADLSAVIAPEAYLDWVRPPLEEPGTAPALQFIGPLGSLAALAPEPLPHGAPDPDATAYLQFSSGTTQAPKGIAISHRAMMANITGMARDALKIGRSDRGVSWLPFYHDMGLVGCMLLPIGTQMSIDYLATRDFIRRPGLWPTMISRAGASMSYAPSFGYELAAKRGRTTAGLDLSRWRIAGIGGDMIKVANLNEFTDAYAPHGFDAGSFLPSYGMAEVSLGLTFSALGSGCRSQRLDLDCLDGGDAVKTSAGRARDFAICGTALPDHRVEIRDPAGMALPEGRVGKVFAQGPSLMQGYFNNPEATAEVLDDRGWLDTGDLGAFIDGELVLTGRAKDLIIVNGRNIWPQDIEWTLEHRVAGAREGGVVAFGGADDPGDGREEEVTIVIECRTSQPDGREALKTEADALVREIHGVSPRVALSKPGLLPRTSSGKLSRAKARDMFLAGSFDG